MQQKAETEVLLTARGVEPRVEVIELGGGEVVVGFDCRTIVAADYGVDLGARRRPLDAVCLCIECKRLH